MYWVPLGIEESKGRPLTRSLYDFIVDYFEDASSSLQSNEPMTFWSGGTSMMHFLHIIMSIDSLSSVRFSLTMSLQYQTPRNLAINWQLRGPSMSMSEYFHKLHLYMFILLKNDVNISDGCILVGIIDAVTYAMIMISPTT